MYYIVMIMILITTILCYHNIIAVFQYIATLCATLFASAYPMTVHESWNTVLHKHLPDCPGADESQIWASVLGALRQISCPKWVSKISKVSCISMQHLTFLYHKHIYFVTVFIFVQVCTMLSLCVFHINYMYNFNTICLPDQTGMY